MIESARSADPLGQLYAFAWLQTRVQTKSEIAFGPPAPARLRRVTKNGRPTARLATEARPDDDRFAFDENHRTGSDNPVRIAAAKFVGAGQQTDPNQRPDA